jgi:uncharacterized protein (DUF169 family)
LEVIVMQPLKTDLSVWKKFEFENPPVGIKYDFARPQGIPQLDKQLNLCEMPMEAHRRNEAFYITKDNESCAGKIMLGMVDNSSIPNTGQIGVEFEIFQDARANRNIYRNQPTMEKGVVKYVAYAPLEKLDFDPDLLFIMATVPQAEIILRATSYVTGEKWVSQVTGVGACAWLYVYPYISGNLNYAITGLGFGMKVKEMAPPGWVMISIPYHKIASITQNLSEIKWVLPSYTDGREKFFEREKLVMEKLHRPQD